MAGFVPIRQNGRVRWWLAHGCILERFGSYAQVAVKAPQTPMRQSPPYSATLSNRNKPGHSRYLRGMLRALRHSVGPVGDQVAFAQSPPASPTPQTPTAVSRHAWFVPEVLQYIVFAQLDAEGTNPAGLNT